MTPNIMPEAPALTVVVLLQRTDNMLPKNIKKLIPPIAAADKTPASNLG
jgi:hypothetical protein